MHANEEDPKGRPSESTISSDSGVIIEESVKLNNDAPNNITINTNITKSNVNSNINNNNNNTSIDNVTNTNNNNCEPTSSYRTDHNIIIEDYDDTKSSPVSSIRSTNISINSLGDSSVVDSDSDFEDASKRDFIIQKLGQHSSDPTGTRSDGVVIINQKVDGDPLCHNGVLAPKPQIGSIAVQNSTDITFGNKTFYQGPVTIKQFLLEKEKWKPMENGNDNPAFRGEDNNENGVSGKKPFHASSDSQQGKYIFNKKIGVIVAVVTVVTLGLAAMAFTVFSYNQSPTYKVNPSNQEESRKHIPVNSTIGDDHITGGNVLRIVTRDEWIAQPPMGDLDPLTLPVNRAIIAQTSTEGCTTQAACAFRVRYIQLFHIESQSWDDIGYNFLIGGDGAVYIGRGWDTQGARNLGCYKGSICVAFIGTFIKKPPLDSQLKATQLLLQEGVRLGKLTSDYKLYGHRQFVPSENPGEALYKIIQTWPHWSDDVGDKN